MIGYESQVVNGQLVNVAAGQAYAPLTFGAEYTGPGYWPRNGVYNVPPVTPSPATALGQPVTPYGMTENPPPTSGSMTDNGRVNFFHPVTSPLLWAIGFLFLGLWMLHYIHYGKG